MRAEDALSRRIAGAIAAARGTPFEPLAREPVGGGCIHAAFRLSGEERGGLRPYFVKVSEASRKPMLDCEAEGLEALRAAGAVATPRVVACGGDGEHAWLVLEWLELAPLSARAAGRLGEALAAQHRVEQPRFGWARDNYIGSSPQPNGWADDWLAFWRARRLMAQLALAARNRLPSRLIDRGERLAADCEAFFRGYAPAKSLLHGDLWGGNAAMTQGDRPVAFDPAVYVGDREADLAMTGLFGGFPGELAAAYAAAWPLHDGYRVRRDFYNLYHVLNHANLFAGGYVRQAEQSVERLLAEIG